MFSIYFYLLTYTFVSVLSSSAINVNQCNPDDDVCVTKALKAVYPLIFEANPEIGAENLDPIYLEVIEGNLSILKFKLFKTNTEGFKQCEVQSAKLNVENLTLHVDLLCPRFSLNGQYDIHGCLIILPVEGDGDYIINTNAFNLSIDADLKTFEGKDGKKIMAIKSFKVLPEALDGVIYDFKNLFNGRKELGDPVLKYANENWKEVTKELQDPVFIANVKKIIKNANIYFKTIPIDDYLKL